MRRSVAIKSILALSAFFLCSGFDVFSSATVGNSSVPEPAGPVELSRYLGVGMNSAAIPLHFRMVV
jgi:lipocalin